MTTQTSELNKLLKLIRQLVLLSFAIGLFLFLFGLFSAIIN